MSLLLFVYNSPSRFPVQSVICQREKCDSTVIITANKMDAHNKTIGSKSTGSRGVHRSMYHTSNNVLYIDWTHGSYLMQANKDYSTRCKNPSNRGNIGIAYGSFDSKHTLYNFHGSFLLKNVTNYFDGLDQR